MDDSGSIEVRTTVDLVDEFLPRLPLKVLPIKLILKIGGKGEPAFKMEVETSLYDDGGRI